MFSSLRNILLTFMGITVISFFKVISEIETDNWMIALGLNVAFWLVLLTLMKFRWDE